MCLCQVLFFLAIHAYKFICRLHSIPDRSLDCHAMTCQLPWGKSVLTGFVADAAPSLAITQDHAGCAYPFNFGQLTTSNEIPSTHYLLALRLGVGLQLIHGMYFTKWTNAYTIIVLATSVTNNGRTLRSGRRYRRTISYSTIPCNMKTVTGQKRLGTTGDERMCTGYGRKH